jgi:multidrug efflux pump subunit AcrB
MALAHGRDENERSTVINHLRGKLATVPGATLILQASQELSIGGRYGNAQYQYRLRSADISEFEFVGSATVAEDEVASGVARSEFQSTRQGTSDQNGD